MPENARDVATQILRTIPPVMQAMAAHLRREDPNFALPHMRVLMALAVEPRTLSELAERREVSLPTMSKTVSTLCARGWVERRADEGDRRRATLRLTDEGRGVMAEMARRAEDAFVELLGPVNAGELDTLRRGLSVLERAVGAAHPPVKNGLFGAKGSCT